jgi:hypothetical protein
LGLASASHFENLIIIGVKLLVHRKLREREGMEGEGLLGWRVGGEGLDGEPPPNRLPFLMWNVNKAAAGLVCADGAVVGLMPPPLLEQQVLTFVLHSEMMSVAINVQD